MRNNFVRRKMNKQINSTEKDGKELMFVYRFEADAFHFVFYGFYLEMHHRLLVAYMHMQFGCNAIINCRNIFNLLRNNLCQPFSVIYL